MALEAENSVQSHFLFTQAARKTVCLHYDCVDLEQFQKRFGIKRNIEKS